MTDYLIKSTLCSAVLIVIYYLLLEKEKMLAFNRFYLILTLTFSFIVPLVPLHNGAGQAANKIISATQGKAILSVDFAQVPTGTIDPITNVPASLTHYIPYFICLLSLVLFARYVFNIAVILRLKAGCDTMQYRGARLILVPGRVSSYTFLNNIFVQRSLFDAGDVRKEILSHELAHAKQLHSLDVLLAELAQALFWFNPFLYFYQKAIRLNHEFLADELVLKEYPDVKSYQLLLLDTMLCHRKDLTSSFNYSITNKRLAMMTNIPSLKSQYVKQCMVGAMLVCATLIFSENSYSQIEITRPNDKVQTETRGSGLSKRQFNDFFATIRKYTTYSTGSSGRSYLQTQMPAKLENRMYALFVQMDRKQQQAVADSGISIFQMPLPVKNHPTTQMFANWKRAPVFGIWINGKHVSNSQLDKYKASDIAEYSLSKLYGAALKGRAYKYQLDLTTNDYFDSTYEKRSTERVAIGRMVRFAK